MRQGAGSILLGIK